jgi:hypothetical protein
VISLVGLPPGSPVELTEQLVSSWSFLPYSELSVALSWLKALSTIHQSHHWQAFSDPFYGDHLMYMRLYEAVQKDVDAMAEKAVGMGTIELVDPVKVLKHTEIILSVIYEARPGIPNPTDLAMRSLTAELHFLKALERISQLLESRSLLTAGIDNQLAGLADLHEQNVYLLKQRAGR